MNTKELIENIRYHTLLILGGVPRLNHEAVWKAYNDTNAELKQRNEEYVNVANANDVLLSRNADLRGQLDLMTQAFKAIEQNPGEPMEVWEASWEQKFQKTRVKWGGRPIVRVNKGEWQVTETAAVDVMAYWQPKSVEEWASMLRSKFPDLIKNKDWDVLAWECEQFVKQKIRYVSELPKEFWKFPFETMYDGTADCEDGAILLGNLMYALGISPGRIKVNVGDVKGGKHAYVSYCRQTDNKHVILDWCYWVTKAKISERKIHSEMYDYYAVDFCFTPKATWRRPDYSEADLNSGSESQKVVFKPIKSNKTNSGSGKKQPTTSTSRSRKKSDIEENVPGYPGSTPVHGSKSAKALPFFEAV